VEKWPNFFIVGAAKAGTTSLYNYLKNIPRIFMSPVKEPRYFSQIVAINNPNRIGNKKKYLDLFKDIKDEKAIGEASPIYLLDPDSPKLIHQAVPNAKIIIILRDPIQRAYSHYLHNVRNGITNVSFMEMITNYLNSEDKENPRLHLLINSSLYSKRVQKYFDTFGSKQVKIIIFEEFVANTKQTINDIIKFLEIDYELTETPTKTYNPFGESRNQLASSIISNKTVRKFAKRIISLPTRKKIVRNIFNKDSVKPEIGIEERKILEKIYKTDVKKIQSILDRSLPWEIASI